jgi:hypothetical protein
MNRQDILNIKLGAKQIPLFFEKDPGDIDKSVEFCILEFAKRYGAVEINPWMTFAQEILPNFTSGQLLQSVFRMVSDQTIGFKTEGRALSAFEAKKRLLESPEEQVFIVFHQAVEEEVLESVQDFFKDLAGNRAWSQRPDPHELSTLLTKQIRYWQDCLGSCRKGAERQRFPGKETVSNGLSLIDRLLERLDPYSLIHSVYVHRKEILRLCEDVKTLYEFYLNHENTWELLIKAADAFSLHAEDLSQIPDASIDLENLNAILLSDRPYHQVEQARRLANGITPHHEEIVKTKIASSRAEAVAKAGRFIEEISATSIDDAHRLELRRKTLQELRTLAKKIDIADNIAAIHEALDEAQDRFDAFQEEIHAISS